MSANVSHLQLKGYFLKELVYSIKDPLEEFPERQENIAPLNLTISDTTVPLDEEKRSWRCELEIESANEHAYEFKIVMVGFFAVAPDLGAEHSEHLAATNCPAVLYSASREIIATTTRRSPYPGTLLPLVNFLGPRPGESSAPPRPKSVKGKQVIKQSS